MRISVIENDLARYMAKQAREDFARSQQDRFQEELWDRTLIVLYNSVDDAPGPLLPQELTIRNTICAGLERIAGHGSVEIGNPDESIEEWRLGDIYDSLPENSHLRRIAKEAMRDAAPILMELEEFD